MLDVVIIGTGPAGLAAAIYAKRARLNMVVIEKAPMSGGQIIDTYEVDNYPGLRGINGFDLAVKFMDHAKELGVDIIEENVKEIIDHAEYKTVVCNKTVYDTKTIIITTGAHHRQLGVNGEQRLSGKGVSYCATCDGAFYKDKVTAVVGGGDVAVEDAIFLSRMCKKVYIIHRRDSLRAAKSLVERAQAAENIEFIWNATVQSINGENTVESLTLNIDGIEDEVNVNGVFIAVGITPETEEFNNVVEMDGQGYIIAGEDCETNVKGIFAAGDVRTKQLRQIVTAVADGANAVTSAERYINSVK